MTFQNSQPDTKTCPYCQHANVNFVTQCVRCGASLSLADTAPLVVSELPLARLAEMAHKLETVEIQELRAGALILYVLDHSKAIIFKEAAEMILGRGVPGDPTPSGDLTPYNAYLLGVSRKHALIARTEDGYTIKDLGSANGTWVNERRLPPHTPQGLKNGDQIWLGQLVILVYLATGAEDAPPAPADEPVVSQSVPANQEAPSSSSASPMAAADDA